MVRPVGNIMPPRHPANSHARTVAARLFHIALRDPAEKVLRYSGYSPMANKAEHDHYLREMASIYIEAQTGCAPQSFREPPEPGQQPTARQQLYANVLRDTQDCARLVWQISDGDPRSPVARLIDFFSAHAGPHTRRYRNAPPPIDL